WQTNRPCLTRSSITDNHLPRTRKRRFCDHRAAHELSDLAHALITLQLSDVCDGSVGLFDFLNSVIMICLGSDLGLMGNGQDLTTLGQLLHRPTYHFRYAPADSGVDLIEDHY